MTRTRTQPQPNDRQKGEIMAGPRRNLTHDETTRLAVLNTNPSTSARRTLHRSILELVEDGASQSQIARVLTISRQRVHIILKKARTAAAKVEPDSTVADAHEQSANAHWRAAVA